MVAPGGAAVTAAWIEVNCAFGHTDGLFATISMLLPLGCGSVALAGPTLVSSVGETPRVLGSTSPGANDAVVRDGTADLCLDVVPSSGVDAPSGPAPKSSRHAAAAATLRRAAVPLDPPMPGDGRETTMAARLMPCPLCPPLLSQVTNRRSANPKRYPLAARSKRALQTPRSRRFCSARPAGRWRAQRDVRNATRGGREHPADPCRTPSPRTIAPKR